MARLLPWDFPASPLGLHCRPCLDDLPQLPLLNHQGAQETQCTPQGDKARAALCMGRKAKVWGVEETLKKNIEMTQTTSEISFLIACNLTIHRRR